MSRRGIVFVHGQRAGVIEETNDGLYRFAYDAEYLQRPGVEPVSLTLPLRATPFEAKALFPFFDGLIPEGWLLDLSVRNWKLDARDRMGLLLTACEDCIGSVHVVQDEATP